MRNNKVRESMIGVETLTEITRLLKKVGSNAPFIDKDDIKVLEHLATKGDYSQKKAILITR